MGIFSKFFKKQDQKKAMESEVQATPIVETPKPLTQDEKNYELLRAVIYENEEKALKMLSEGADPNYEDRGNGSVILRLSYSIFRPKEGFDTKKVFDAAMKAGLDLNKENKEGLTPLMQIAGDGLGHKIVEQIMQWGYGHIDENKVTKNGEVASEFVKSHLYRMKYGSSRWSAMKKIEAGRVRNKDIERELNEVDNMVKSWKMIHAVMRGDQEETLKLLNEGANPNCISPVNGTFVEQLAGAIDNPKDGFDVNTVFDVAIQKGLDVNRYDGYSGHTPITAMISKGVSDMALNGILKMADKVIDMNAMDSKGKTVEQYLKERQEKQLAFCMARKRNNIH